MKRPKETVGKIKEDRQRLGERLKNARTYLGFTQDEVAKFLSIPRSALSELESGRRRVDIHELTKLAKLYRQPLSYFSEESEEASALPPDVMHLARQAADLSEQDRSELQKFTDYLRSRSKAQEDR